jgi:integrase/recombinase XerD
MRVAECVEIYIRRKQECGYGYTSTAKVLRRFARFVGPLNIRVLSERHINAFLKRGKISNNTWQIYGSHLRQLCRYWLARREMRRIPYFIQKPRLPKTFIPYIYTREELRRLVDAVDICQRAPRCLIGPNTLRTILLFLYGTGSKI